MRLVLLPGLDGTGLLFEPFIECLPTDLEPVVIALPNDVPLGYADLALRLAAAVPRTRPFILLGESFSGPLALLLAATRPAGLAGVVLCASFVSNPTYLPAIVRHGIRPWLFRFTPAFVQAKALLGGHASPRLRSLLARALGAVPPHVMAGRVRSVLTVDATSALATCPVPLAYLRGTRDLVVPARNAAQFCAINHDVRVITISGPHLVLQVQPAASAAAIVAFASSIAVQRKR